jgi:hypothetical protein
MIDEQRQKRLLEAQDSEDSWQEWSCLTPLERWHESMKLWQFFLSVGGSLDPEPDPQSPFDAFLTHSKPAAYGGWSRLRVIRRGRV